MTQQIQAAPGLTLADIAHQIEELRVAILATDDVFLLKPAEVAGILGYKKSKVYELIADGTIPSIRLGDDGDSGSIRVPLVALRAMIAGRAGGLR